MPVVDKKPIDTAIDYAVQLKILLQEQQKMIEDLKKEVKSMKASISVLTDNIREQNDIHKKGWFY